MVLTKNCKIVLDYLITFHKAGNLDKQTFNAGHKPSRIDFKEFLIIMKDLKKYGYIDYHDLSTFEANDISFVELSSEALHYKEVQWLSVKEFLFKSILVPIGVSIATTLLLTLLG